VRPIYRTGTPLPSTHPIFYIFSTNTSTEFFKDAAHSPFLSLQNAVYFIMLPSWFLYYSHFIYRMCSKLKTFRCQKFNGEISEWYVVWRSFVGRNMKLCLTKEKKNVVILDVKNIFSFCKFCRHNWMPYVQLLRNLVLIPKTNKGISPPHRL
jgi:hypothetical protein